jgi:hypothetical protein
MKKKNPYDLREVNRQIDIMFGKLRESNLKAELKRNKTKERESDGRI